MRSKSINRRLRRRVASRGMTLIEIMIVVIIMALIATGVAFAVIPMLDDARKTQTGTDLRVIHQAVTMYMVRHGNCPESVQTLVDDRQLTSSARTTDAWGNDFEISCEGDEPVVISHGPDGNPGTEDDIRTDQSNQ